MKINDPNMKAENYNSELLDSMLDSITPEEQKSIDRKMMLASKIYNAMKAKGWNQKTFAEAMGKKQPEISKWLSGTHNFTADVLWSIGDVLGCDLLPVKEANKVLEIKYVTIMVESASQAKVPVFSSGFSHSFEQSLMFSKYLNSDVNCIASLKQSKNSKYAEC